MEGRLGLLLEQCQGMSTSVNHTAPRTLLCPGERCTSCTSCVPQHDLGRDGRSFCISVMVRKREPDAGAFQVARSTADVERAGDVSSQASWCALLCDAFYLGSEFQMNRLPQSSARCAISTA